VTAKVCFSLFLRSVSFCSGFSHVISQAPAKNERLLRVVSLSCFLSRKTERLLTQALGLQFGPIWPLRFLSGIGKSLIPVQRCHSRHFGVAQFKVKNATVFGDVRLVG